MSSCPTTVRHISHRQGGASLPCLSSTLKTSGDTPLLPASLPSLVVRLDTLLTKLEMLCTELRLDNLSASSTDGSDSPTDLPRKGRKAPVCAPDFVLAPVGQPCPPAPVTRSGATGMRRGFADSDLPAEECMAEMADPAELLVTDLLGDSPVSGSASAVASAKKTLGPRKSRAKKSPAKTAV